MTMATRTCITVLPDGRFSIADLGEESPPSFVALSPALSEQELRDELILRGVDKSIVDDLIDRAKRKGTEVY
jgi:hypothetical protein